MVTQMSGMWTEYENRDIFSDVRGTKLLLFLLNSAKGKGNSYLCGVGLSRDLRI